MSESEPLELNDEDIEIIDFQNSKIKPEQSRPVPTGIKLLIGGIAFVVLAGGSLYAFNARSSVNPESDVTIAGDSDQMVATKELIVNLNKTRAKSKTALNTLSLGPVNEQEKLNERVISMEMQIKQMAQQINDFEVQSKAVRQLNTQVGEFTKHLKTVVTQDEFTAMKQDFSKMLQKTQDELKNSWAKTYKKARANITKKKSKPVQIPFKLVSIDQWNGVDYAAIQSKNIGAIENLRLGDTRSGWKVERIDTAESAVVFKNIKTSHSIKQTSI